MPEQKIMSWLKDSAGESTRKGDLVMDLSITTCSRAKAFVLLDQHRKFSGYNLDSDLLSTVEPSILL